MKECKVNYVIGTCGNRKLRTIGIDELPIYGDYLKIQLKALLETDLCSNDQVTIMRPDIENIDQDYYDIADIKLICPIVIHDCKNEYLSYGQWIKCYQIYREAFDYYIFIEDDYKVANSKFRQLLIEEFELSKKSNKHYLCTMIRPWDSIPFVAAISNGITSQESLSLIEKEHCFPKDLTSNPQVGFSSFFESLSDYSAKYMASFWASSLTKNILFHRDIFPKENIFIPLQWDIYSDKLILREN